MNEKLYLYHYYEKGCPAWQTLSDLSEEDAESVQNALKEPGNVYDRRDHDGSYMRFRRMVEDAVRDVFAAKGGKIERNKPFYSILGRAEDDFQNIAAEWYREPACLKIPLTADMADCLSFTYGDSFVVNHPEHSDQNAYAKRVCLMNRILELIRERGWPQDLAAKDDPFWVPRYIESQLWCDPKTIMPDIVRFTASLQEQSSVLFRRYFDELGETWSPDGRHADVADIRHSYMENGCFWCLTYGSRVIGAVGVRKLELYEDSLEVKRFYIEKAYRGMGFGSEMLKTVISFARNERFSALYLDSRKDLAPALHLYDKFGFEPVSQYDPAAKADLYFRLILNQV